MKVDVKRIQNDIETLATFNETPGCGVTRSSYTKEDKMAKEYLISEMEKLDWLFMKMACQHYLDVVKVN